MSSEPQLPTPRTQPPHLDVDLAADLDAGLLDDVETETWLAHAGTCDRCAGLLASIRGVRDGLAALPAVEPMPEALRTRWTTALAESPVLATEPEVSVPVRRSQARRRPRANRSLLQLAAVAAACLAVFGITRVLPSSSSGGGSSASSGGSAAAPAASAGVAAGAAAGAAPASSSGASGGREMDSASSPAAKTAAPLSSAGSGGGSGSGPAASPSPPRTPARVLATTPAGLARQAATLLASRQYSAAGPTLPSGCRTGLGGAAPELAVPGTFRGQPALLVVQPLGTARLRVTVVRRPCGSQQAREPLLSTDTARPVR